MTDLRQAAQTVLDRWDSPEWEWLKHGPTAALMADLRAALAEPEQAQRWAVFCAGCRKEWSVPYQHPGKSVCADCEARLKAERDALRADAERYRWLRTCRDNGFWQCHEKDGEGGQILRYGVDLDAAIDAAREAK